MKQNIKVPKKRGRKPKTVPTVYKSQNEDIKTNHNVILHLNILNNETESPNPTEPNKVYHGFNNETNKQYLNEINDIIEQRQSLNNNGILLQEYNTANITKTWPSKTNIACFWDCHTFTNTPVGLPMKKTNNTIYMFGNFCSPECTAAYNFNMNDDNMWDRYALLNELYSDNNQPINIASTKLLLRKFGGIYNIDQFRYNKTDKHYTINMPPIVSYIPSIEESLTKCNKVELSNNSNTQYNIKCENDILNSDKNSSLENIMNIKYV